MTATLFTSIPPRTTRRDRAGRDVGAAYVARCIESWRAAHCRIVSINGPEEAEQVAALYPSVEVVPAPRTALERTGRPLIFVADLLAACGADAAPMVGVINADLFVHDPARLNETLSRADAGAVLYGRRLDVDDIEAPDVGQLYTSGLDYFFFAPAAARDLADEGFLLGETWWDYWLPIVLAKRGCRLRPQATPLVLHLRHDESSIELRAPTYLGYFHGFARALNARLPLPGDEPWAVAVRPILATFLRHYRATAPAHELVFLSQYVSFAVSLYLAQDPALFATFATAWRGVCAGVTDHQQRQFAQTLLDGATRLAEAAAGRA